MAYGLSIIIDAVADGYVDVDIVLRHRNFRGVTLEDLQSLVENNDKKRFALILNDKTKKWQIKANQGHTLKVNKSVQTTIRLKWTFWDILGHF